MMFSQPNRLRNIVSWFAESTNTSSSRTPLGKLIPLSSLICFLWFANLSVVSGADTDEAKKLLRTGEYEACIAMAKQEVTRGVWNELWPRILIEARLATGAYAEAVPEYDAAIEKFSTSIRLRLLGAQVYRMNNQSEKAVSAISVIPELMQRMPWRFTGKDELVPLGEFFLLQGEDPKQVLEICYDRAFEE